MKNEKEISNNNKYETTLLQDILHLLLKIASVVGVGVLLFTFIFGIFRTPDLSMSPAIKDGDLVAFYRLDKNYMRNDVLVVKYKDKYQSRRVLAVGGDSVDIKEDGLYINGYKQVEPEIYSETYAFEEGVKFPITVGQGEVFVMGDNREDSTDSRIYGSVKIKDTLGKVMTIVRRRGI